MDGLGMGEEVCVCAHLFCRLKFRDENVFFQTFGIQKMKIRQKKNPN